MVVVVVVYAFVDVVDGVVKFRCREWKTTCKDGTGNELRSKVKVS